MTQLELFGVCPYATVQKILSGKWALLVLFHLSQGTMRFGELLRALPEDITQATLTKQLRALEHDGLVIRTVYAQVPPRVDYALSPIGESFRRVLDSLAEWGHAYIAYRGLGAPTAPPQRSSTVL